MAESDQNLPSLASVWSERPRALVPRRLYHMDAEKLLSRQVDIVRCDPRDVAALLRAVADVHVLIPSYTAVTERLLAAAEHLLIIAMPSAGYDKIDVPAATRAGIPVATNAGMSLACVAEFALGMMLGLSRGIVRADRELRAARNWNQQAYLDPARLMGRDLEAKTVGILGLGGIGTRLAKMCRHGFDMRVLAYHPRLSAEEVAERGATKVDDLHALAAESDFLSLHVPLTPETEGMVNAEVLAAMKPSAYVINCARGGVLDEAALLAALRSDQIAGAGLDVWAQEPPPRDHPFFEMDNVVIAPHIAGGSQESAAARAVALVRNVLQALLGERPEGLINPDAWPRFQERRARLGLSSPGVGPRPPVG